MSNNSATTIAPEQHTQAPEMTEREKSLKKYETTLLKNTWAAAFSDETPELSEAQTNDEKAQVLWDNLVPEFDKHIEKWKIPTRRNPNESDEEFFTRVVNRMSGLNNENRRKDTHLLDAFPKTANEIGVLNCGLGSLVLARALEIAGEDIEDIEMGFPGPLGHAVIIHKGFYLDQANNAIEPIQRAETIAGIETYVLDLPGNHIIPFTRVPVTTPQRGIARVISNLDVLVTQANNGNEESRKIAEWFKLPMKMEERGGDPWGRENLIGTNWTQKEFLSHQEWQQEVDENKRRFNLTPTQ